MKKFLVYMERLDTDPFKLIWRMREAKKNDWGCGSRLHACWMSIDDFDEQDRLSGYLGDFCFTHVTAYNVETALRKGIKRIFVEMNYGFENYPWDKFTHVFEWDRKCINYKKLDK
jgi:hypothetical protein